MDGLLANTQTVQGFFPFWDFQVVGDIVPIILNVEEQSQQATVICYTQKNLIPQLPTIGINWAGLLLNTETLSAIDSQIVTALQQNSLPYKPVYTQEGNKLKLNVVQQ
jgi:hypothetical protein